MATVTLLFTDLVGSTELLTRLGDESGEAVRRAHFRILRGAVAERGGEEVKNLGDGLMVAFPSALDAVGCAVGMQQAVVRHNRQPGAVPLGVRIGLHVGEPIREEDDYFGSAVVIAKRLCDAATGGQILASDVVRGVLGGRGAFALKPLGPIALKGLGDPLPACEVAWEAEATSTPLPPAIAAAEDTRPVGRDAALDHLGEVLREVRGRTTRLVLLAGEPGIGKTTLAVEVARRAHAEGATVLYGRCDDSGLLPYQPFVEGLRHLVTAAPEADLRAALGETGHELVRVLPELGERIPDLPEPLKAEPAAERLRLLDAVGEVLAGLAARSPVVFVLDDLHWADTPTLLLLKHLVRAGGPAAVLLLGTYRDVELDRRHPLADTVADLRRDGLVERVLLRGLGVDDVLELLEARGGAPLDPRGRALGRALHVETEGNPFFIREILRHLVETGAVRRDEDRWTSDVSLDQIGLPESVRDVIGRRLSRLSEQCNDVLRLAAVVGRSFSVAVLSRIAELDEAAVVSALDEATRAQVVVESPEEFDRYAFAHMLIQETLYSELTTSRRVRLHQRIGLAIEELGGDRADTLADLAHHFREAALIGETGRAVTYGLAAGQRAMDLLAYEEAALRFDRALQAIDVSEEDRPLDRCELLVRKGEALTAMGDPAGGRKAFVDASTIAAELPSPEHVARAALGGGLWPEVGGIDPQLTSMLRAALDALPAEDSILRCRVQSRLAMELAFALDSSGIPALAADTLAMARRLGDERTLAYADVARRHAVTGPGSLEERLAVTAEALAIAEAEGDREMALRVATMRASDVVERGDYEGWVACEERVAAIAGELRQPRFEYLATLMRATKSTAEGRFDDATAFTDRAQALAIELGRITGLVATGNLRVTHALFCGGLTTPTDELERFGAIFGDDFAPLLSIRGVAALERGNLDEASAFLDQLMGGYLADAPDDWSFWGILNFATLIAHGVGSTDAAARLLELGAPYAGRHAHSSGTGLTLYGGPVNMALGLLHAILGELDSADAAFERAVVEALSMHAPPFAAWIQMEHARVLHTRSAPGDQARAEVLVEEALATAERLGADALASRARATRDLVRAS